MNVERDLHMTRGDGEHSYASNSRLQEKSILKTRPVLHKAVVAAAHACLSLSSGPGGAMVVADLGCSSGPNTLLVVSEVIKAVADCCRHEQQLAAGGQPQHVQFFLNDLPGNDFNLVFQSLELIRKLAAKDGLEEPLLPPYYVAGLPGSFYTRLFPDRTVHLFHSSYCLMWRSKVPDELAAGAVLNEGHMYIWETTPPAVVALYRTQFQEDLSLFLRLRHRELVTGGHMVLTLVGRKSKDGRVEKEKLDSFNLPFYAPSLDEVRDVIARSQAFDVTHFQLFDSNWDPHDDDDDDDAEMKMEEEDAVQSGVNVAMSIRAAIGPLIARHFGEHILDDLFELYAKNVAVHLQKVKTRYPVIVVSLQAK
ncbi:Salicylate/benzoate carboxyl methyltransferase [Zea mays]|uniref:Salicylate/benzoate carboxyl methyltransferase n=1 Tax=Zea mays TaxID=4577 RepID=A0A1D6QK95_MAIZE|nr:Salicylate/benzoate carboxyl methyltransferase [Zea mays]